MNKKKAIIIAAVIIILLLLICLIFFLMNRKYTVTFETSAGVTTETQVIKKDDLAKEPEAPTKEGYVFAGWYYEDDQDTKYDFSSKVNKDIKLIAKWEKEDEKLTGVSISASKSTLEINDELTLSIKTQPEGINLEGKNISWTSSDTSVVTVDENGKVKALKAGTATITVEVDGIKATVGIKVNAKVEEEKKEETKKNDTNTNKNSNTNTSKNNNTTKPTETKPETKPKTKVTYTYKWEDVGSVVGQYRLFIVDSNGKKVAGTATLTSTDGDTISVSIPESGVLYVKAEIKSVTNIKAK